MLHEFCYLFIITTAAGDILNWLIVSRIISRTSERVYFKELSSWSVLMYVCECQNGKAIRIYYSNALRDECQNDIWPKIVCIPPYSILCIHRNRSNESKWISVSKMLMRSIENTVFTCSEIERERERAPHLNHSAIYMGNLFLFASKFISFTESHAFVILAVENFSNRIKHDGFIEFVFRVIMSQCLCVQSAWVWGNPL